MFIIKYMIIAEITITATIKVRIGQMRIESFICIFSVLLKIERILIIQKGFRVHYNYYYY